jgi:hypothetical protein
MSSALNLYATKVFAEHPLCLWALDEKVGYISLLSDSDQILSNWVVESADVVNAKTSEQFDEIPPKEPFETVRVNGLIENADGMGETFPPDPKNKQKYKDYFYDSTKGYWVGTISLESARTLQPSDISADLGSFSIGLYAFTYNRSVDVAIGYSYFDVSINDTRENVRLTRIPPKRNWAFLSETFSLPAVFSDLKIIIEFYFQATDVPYQLAVNGISWGQ